MLSRPVLFVDVGELGEYVAVPFVEAVGVKSSAAGGDPQDGQTPLPSPIFDLFTEAEANLAVAMAVLDDESADQGVWRGLEMVLDGDLDPPDDFICDARDEGGLSLGANGQGFDPSSDFGRGALVTELSGEGGDLGCISEFDGTDDDFGKLSGGIVHAHHVLMQVGGAVR